MTRESELGLNNLQSQDGGDEGTSRGIVPAQPVIDAEYRVMGEETGGQPTDQPTEADYVPPRRPPRGQLGKVALYVGSGILGLSALTSAATGGKGKPWEGQPIEGMWWAGTRPIVYA